MTSDVEHAATPFTYKNAGPPASSHSSEYVFSLCFVNFFYPAAVNFGWKYSSHVAVLVWLYSGTHVCWHGVCNTCFINSLSRMLYVCVRDVHLQYHYICIRELVDSLGRDGADTPIVRVHTNALETLERSRSKPFRAPSYPIPAFVYPTMPPK